MRKVQIAIFVGALIGIAALTATWSSGQTPPGKKQGKGAQQATGWQANPDWVETRYGGWGGPGVDPQPGPMDTILLKDWAPKTSVVVPETIRTESQVPCD